LRLEVYGRDVAVARELGIEWERQFVQVYGRTSGRSNERVSCDFMFSLE